MAEHYIHLQSARHILTKIHVIPLICLNSAVYMLVEHKLSENVV